MNSYASRDGQFRSEIRLTVRAIRVEILSVQKFGQKDSDFVGFLGIAWRFWAFFDIFGRDLKTEDISARIARTVNQMLDLDWPF